MSYRLTIKQKWKLSATLLLLYYPVLLYIDLPLYMTDGIAAPGLFLQESVTAVIVLLLFFVWINIAEWLLNLVFARFGEEFLTRFNLWAQLATFVAAVVLGLGFVMASGEILEKANLACRYLFGASFLIAFPTPKTMEFFELYKRANIGFFMVLVISAFYLIGIRRSEERVRAAALRTAKLEQENAVAQLLALRNQVNPHFLFNSLSILDSMVHEDSNASSAFINELAKFYRYSLEQARDETVVLQTELEFIRSYSYLLQMRFENKIIIDISVDENHAKTKRIPPLTLQLLIENAVKHNTISKIDPLVIKIILQDDYLVVKNSLHPKPTETIAGSKLFIPSTGTGLTNIRERYKLLTAEPVIVSKTDHAFEVQVPLLN